MAMTMVPSASAGRSVGLVVGIGAAVVLSVGAAMAQTAEPAEDRSPTTVQAMPAPSASQAGSMLAEPIADRSKTGAKKTKDKTKKQKVKKEKKPKLTPVHIVDGILTVDGMAGKAALNYDIANLEYVYIWAPGIGTAVIANHAFPLAKEQKGAFDGAALTVTVDGHQLQLTSSERLLGKKPESAWVRMETGYQYPWRYPAVGYGNAAGAPFVWPGSRQSAGGKAKDDTAPPLPKSMLPVQLAVACPSSGLKSVGCVPAKPAAVPVTTTPPASSTTPQ